MEKFLKTERKGSILTIRMDRPETHNALTDVGQMKEFTDLCYDLERDPSVKVIILTGNGKSFCSGGNVKDMRGRTGIFAGTPYELRNSYRTGIQTIPLALYNLEIPIIAAINGAAIGAGLDLACMCDIRIASTKAIFAESFVRLGIVPGDGGAWLLQKVIGSPKASLMALTGQTIKADQALAWDLVAEVVEADQLEARAFELAEQIAANPGPALRLTKRLLREAQHMKLDSLLEMSAAYQALAHHTEEHSEAVDKFFNKKPKKT
ncbi:MAG: enoyl-CoA hydratase [Robiginitomaculum sp.]|nr:MAG: enoyl-CoA hydratase [Robiginitomaculum sp.]